MLLTYKILSNENIFSAVVKNNYPLDNIVSLMKNNDYELDTDFESESGEIEFDDSDINLPSGGQIAVPPTSTVGTAFTNSTMNIYDVILNTIGDLNKTIYFLKAEGYNFTNTNAVVDGVYELSYTISDITDNAFKIAAKNIVFATGDNIEGHSFDYGFDYSFDS